MCLCVLMLGDVHEASGALLSSSQTSSRQPSASRDTTSLRGIPIVEVAPPPTGDRLALLLTGDGGWAAFDRDLARELTARSIAVIGFDLQAFLREQKTPDATAAAAWTAIRAYLERWHRTRIIVVGYSRGADLAPFVVRRVPADLAAHVALMTMLAPDTYTRFKVTRMDLIFTHRRPDDLPLLPELRALPSVRILCIKTDRPDLSGCDQLAGLDARTLTIPGGHHFGNDFKRIASLIDDESVRH